MLFFLLLQIANNTMMNTIKFNAILSRLPYFDAEETMKLFMFTRYDYGTKPPDSCPGNLTQLEMGFPSLGKCMQLCHEQRLLFSYAIH